VKNDKINVAVCFGGRMNNIEIFDFYKLWKDHSRVNFDFFISTWDYGHISNQNENFEDDFEYDKKIFDNFKGISILVDENRHPPKSGYAFLKQAFHQINVNKIKCKYENKNNFKYDLVIHSRPDVLLEINSIERIAQKIIHSDDIITCSNVLPCKDKTHPIYNQEKIDETKSCEYLFKHGNPRYFMKNDMSMCGKSEIMDEYCKFVKIDMDEFDDWCGAKYYYDGHHFFGTVIGRSGLGHMEGSKMMRESGLHDDHSLIGGFRNFLIRAQYDVEILKDNITLPFYEIINKIVSNRQNFEWFRKGNTW
jgi:hypothetical protein